MKTCGRQGDMTKIEWLRDVDGNPGETWNPVTGCTPISEGCEHCYAKRMAQRLAGRYGYPRDDPFRPGTVHPDKMDLPLHWKKPRRIFVCSMGDLFHDDIPDIAIDDVLAKCYFASWHTFIFLTKRPENMAAVMGHFGEIPPNWCLGVTGETQEWAEKRWAVLTQIPARVRFLSVEPMLGPVSIAVEGWWPVPDWVICSAETGPGARPMNADWARKLRNECVGFGVPFFLKRGSDGSRLLDGKKWEEYPDE